MVEVENHILNEILTEVKEIKSELTQLKQENEKYYWSESIQNSLNKTWNNKSDENWSQLL